ncbi:MAG: DUF4381 domain-containing protein [Gammaproteobacteria bacterium]|jgi:hypothetical protein
MNTAAAPLLELRDIHAAPPPGLWPPAPGWWVLGVLLAGLLVLGLLWLRRRYRKRRFRHQVMLELERIKNKYEKDDYGLIAETGVWLRRVALHRYPVEQVASLTGSAWLEFLDATGGAGEFCNGVGKVLETGPYTPRVPTVAGDSLLALARNWGQKNLEASA